MDCEWRVKRADGRSGCWDPRLYMKMTPPNCHCSVVTSCQPQGLLSHRKKGRLRLLTVFILSAELLGLARTLPDQLVVGMWMGDSVSWPAPPRCRVEAPKLTLPVREGQLGKPVLLDVDSGQQIWSTFPFQNKKAWRATGVPPRSELQCGWCGRVVIYGGPFTIWCGKNPVSLTSTKNVPSFPGGKNRFF